MIFDDDDLEYLINDPIVRVHIDLVIEDAMQRIYEAQILGDEKKLEVATQYFTRLEKVIMTPNEEARGWYNPNDNTFFYERLIHND